jgi:leucyl-tRNA synthetase
MGLCSFVRLGFEITLGSSMVGREFIRFDHLHGVLHSRAPFTRLVYVVHLPTGALINSPSIEDVKGERAGTMGIKASEMTDGVWDYIFRDGPFPADTTIPKKHLDHLKSDFNYFYPFDIRSSGKDLIPNHLTFCVYNHAALFPEDKWPASMRTNGHLMLNGKKMSKSTGNSLTMKGSVVKFGADVTRVVLADAGDGIEDANFEEKNANANVLRIHTLVQWSEVSVLLSLQTGTSGLLTGRTYTGNDQGTG